MLLLCFCCIKSGAQCWLNIFLIHAIYAIYHANHHIRQRLSRYVGNFCIAHTLNPPVISQNNVPLHWNWLNDRGLFELAVVVVFVVRHLGVPLFLNFDQFGYASGLLSLSAQSLFWKSLTWEGQSYLKEEKLLKVISIHRGLTTEAIYRITWIR